MSVLELDAYRQRVERAHLVPPRPEGGLPPAYRASELPDPPPIAWLIDQVWPAGEFGLLVGDGGAFKSSVAIHMALAVAGGHRLFDEYQCLPRPALVVSAEDHRDIVLMRAKAFCAGHGWGRATLDNFYILAEGGPTLGDSEWCAHITAEVERIRPGMIVLDPWAELMGGDENSNSDARPTIKFLRHLAAKVCAAVVLVHHAGKMKEGGRALDRIRGASALPSAARVVWFFDFTDAGLTVENLKHSRAPRIPTFQLDRDIRSVAGNVAQWVSARVTKKTVEDPIAVKVIGHLMQAPDGERSFNDLMDLMNVSRRTLRLTLDRMVSTGSLVMREGARKSQLYSRPTTGTHWYPPQGTSPPAPNAPPVPSGGDLVPPPLAPPLRGGALGYQSSDAGATPKVPVQTDPEMPQTASTEKPAGTSREPVREPVTDPVDILARLEERRGMNDSSS